MALSGEMRRLQNKWTAGQAWPKRLEWIEIDGVRGWTGQRIDFNFPIVALVGENGSAPLAPQIAAMYREFRKVKQDVQQQC